ncbi:putative polyketide synthase [Hypoxylon cercidicola]|nr:putative polyketide synthase [Hypoxylon cercidicola]
MSSETPIAVVGLAYRAPGVGRKGLWDYLSQARSAWTKIPAERFDHSAYYKPGGDKSGVYRAEGAHFVPDNIYAFDAAFFNMRADEARNSDPQHRMLLECALEAAEDAGHSLLDLAGKNIGVFIGSGQSEYSHRLGDDEHSAKTWTATGIAPCMAANRISYFFDIDGPSITLDAACASSVYAAHQAVSALRQGECESAFVGAASLSLGPGGWIALEKTGALSAHGRSYSYDSKAEGFGRGEGAACLLIKRLGDAVRDGDPIHAVIRSSACNHGGRSEGITMPNGIAHRKLLLAVHEAAGLNPSETAVVEGHGTGTAAGDPVEAGAFTAVLAKERTASNPIYIGSIKSNFGHLEGASGALGIVKAILMIKHGVILPTAGFESINPRIQDKEKIRVPQTPIPWPEGERKRIMVTNFGFGGSNSAIILEEPPSKYAGNGVNGLNGMKDANGVNGFNGDNVIHNANGTNGQDKASKGPIRQLFVLSAKTEKSLTSYLSSFDEYLDEAPESNDFVKNLSYTLGQRRTHRTYRVSAVADSVESLQDKLLTVQPTRSREQTIAFVFTGQGAQYAQMASGLRHYKIFADAVDEAEAQIRKMGAPWSLTEELAKLTAASRVDDAEISQPACTAVQMALVLLLKSWAIVPTMVTGHSSGEIAAAFSAGLVSFRSAIAIAYYRGQVAARLARHQSQKGAMLALGVDSEEAIELIEKHAGGYATVAAINSPQSVTISGDQSAIENVHKAADAQGLFARRLKIQMAYHSRHMEEGAAYYLDAIKPYCVEDVFSLKGQDVSRPVFVSSVTGHVADPDDIDESYWVKNLVRPVRFLDAVQTAFTPREKGTASAGRGIPSLVVEIGPHSALKNPIKQILELVQLQRTDRQQASAFTYVPTLVRGMDSDEAMLTLAGSLFTMGVPVELAAVNQTNMRNAHVVIGIPPYEYDKSVSYEIRPRATDEKLFPGDSYNPLLGRRVRSSGGKERAYRQVFTLDEMPWIREHNVAGAVIFPMTGYMSCAIEAARRTLSAPAAAFLVTDFHAVRRLEIQEEETVDMITKMRPAATGTGTTSSTAWTFEISAWTEAEGWTIHAHGRIEPEMAEMTINTPTLKIAHPLVGTTPNLIEYDMAHAYEYAGVRGTRYGPTFRNTVKFFEGHGYTVLEHKLRDLGESLGPFGSPVSVDPPTLDGFLQGGGPLQKTEDGRRRAQMPNYISRFRVSNNIPAEPGQRFDIVTRLLDHDVKGGRMHISIAAFSRGRDDLLTPVAEWESVAFRSIGAVEDDLDPTSNLPDNWAWDLLNRFDLIPPSELAKKVTTWDAVEAEVVRAAKLTKVACYYIDRGMKQTANDDRSKLPFHLARFVNWATKNLPKYGMHFETEPTELLNDVRNDAQGQLLCFVGERLVQILREEIEPLEIMLAEGRLTRYYEADAVTAHFSKVLGELVVDLADLNPHLRILEIGGGTAGTTLPVLEELTRDREHSTFSNFTFTDISSGFFENARVKLAKWSQRITYQKLDISMDPVEQGFTPGDFDVIIAANVLHATKNMTVTMANVRKLLTPGGKLFLLEGNRHPPFLLPFFLLPGWWYAEDEYRDHEEGPLMSVAVWNRLLLNSGFSGVDVNVNVNVQDRPGSDLEIPGVVCSTRIGQQEYNQPITVCGPFMDDDEVEFAQLVADSVSEELGCPIETRPFAEIDPAEEPYYIFIDSPRHSVMQNVSSEKFDSLKNLLLRNTGLLWVVPSGGSPESKAVKGMIRTLRIENDPKNLFTLDDIPLTSQGVSEIAKLAKTLRDPEVTRTQDQDFVWHNGSIHLPRMRLVKDTREHFAVEQGIYVRKAQNIWEGDRALEMTIDSAGSPDSIYFRRTDAIQRPISEDEIVVRVEAAGVSHRDLSLVLGSIPWAPPGFDGVGKIAKTGSRVTDLREGDLVFFLSLEGSAFTTYKKMPFWHAAKVPDGMNVTDAASLPLAYSVAVLALIRTARLRKNDTVLIHAAAGAVGQACVVLAQHLGAQIFATAGTETKRKFLHESLGIPKNRIFSSRKPGLRDSILCETNGRGVDVIVSAIGGELLTETWGVCAKFGRFVEVGKKDMLENKYLPMRPFSNNVTFTGIDLRDLFQHRPEDVREIFSEVVTLLQRGVVVPIKPVTVLPISQFGTALRRLKSGENIGKIVVTLGAGENVVAETTLRPTQATLNPNATYLITGGTRGIGLNLAFWMIEHGARNLVLLGRSGASGPEIQKLLKRYEGTDIRIRAPPCDVGSREDLAKALESVTDLPRVRGVVHGALLLSDKLFENTTYEDWEIITRPRITGAWNLHELLPNDLDFFILLGSFLGDVGNAGQAIYASTASFYDAFTQYRNARGQYTVCVALPVVLDVGYVADNNLSNILKQSLGATLTMADIRTIIKGAIMGESSPFHHNGKAAVFKMYLNGQPIQDGPWKYFHPVHTKQRLTAEYERGKGSAGGKGGGKYSTSWTAADDPLLGLTGALITKISAMTMIDIDEVGADIPLSSYGLDSLVSVELRNWIRRETGVEMLLSAITQAENLQSLAADVLAQREGQEAR